MLQWAHVVFVITIETNTNMVQLQCSLCSSFASTTFQGVLRHIGTEHAFDSNFHLQCGLDGCQRTFHKYSSWRSHLYH